MLHTPVPLPQSIAALKISERMAMVIRSKAHEGQPTTRDDFHQALETSDLSDTQLDANIGEAKRLMHPEVVRHDQPPKPVMPWDHDPEYRRERVTYAASLVTGAPCLVTPVAVATLRTANYSPAEIAALWPEIMNHAAGRIALTPLPAEFRP